VIAPLKLGETGANALEGGLGGVALAKRAGPSEEGLDLSELLAKMQLARRPRPRNQKPLDAARQTR